MSFEFTDELKKKMERVEELSSMNLVYGVVDEEKTTDGVLVWKYAIYVEYGTNRIPERPFFRSFQWNKKTILDTMTRRLFSNVVNGDIKKPITAYKRLGRYMKSAIEDSLLNGAWQPNAESTVKLKGSDRPLVDTGNLLNSIGFVIYKDDAEIYREVGNA